MIQPSKLRRESKSEYVEPKTKQTSLEYGNKSGEEVDEYFEYCNKSKEEDDDEY